MTPSKACLYVRISEDKAGDALGVERQEAELREWAKRQKWTVAEVYTDNDFSAYNGKIRPDYQRMLKDVRAGKRDGILAWAWDRLTKSQRELADVVELGVPVGTIEGSLDLSGPGGELIATVLVGVARHEGRQKSERHKAQIKQAAYAGQPLTHKRPFGWTSNKMDELHPEESKLIKEAAADLLAGASVRGVVVRWNKAGIKTSAGNEWHRVSFKDMMSRWANAGIPVHLGEPLMDVQGLWKPILDKDTLLAVRAVTSPGGVQKTAARSYLLSGILVCSKCGKRFVANSGRYWCPGTINGTCTQTISPQFVEPRVIAWTLIQVYVHAQQQLEDQSSKERAAVEVALSQIRDEREAIARMDDLSLESRIALLRALEARESDLKQQAISMVQNTVLGALTASLAPMKGTVSLLDNRSEELKEIRARWEKLDFAQKRLLLQSFGKFKVHPGRGANRLEILAGESG